MVIAIGTPANDALWYNACNFSDLGTSTPFNDLTVAQDTLPAPNFYMNAAGATSQESQQLAYNYAYYALHGNCTGCPSGGTPQTPQNSCKGRNPVNGNGSSFGTTCPNSSNTCVSGVCEPLSTIESIAVNSGWDPEALAQTVLDLMSGMGVNTLGMDKYMALAAMEEQGCYNCPDACEQLKFPCGNCGSPETNEGFGVQQESYNGTALNHASMALTGVTDNNQSTSVWFPSGITACLILKDSGTAFKEFYWAARDYMASYGYNTCQAVGAWKGGPPAGVSCGESRYTDQTGISC